MSYGEICSDSVILVQTDTYVSAPQLSSFAFDDPLCSAAV